LPGHAPSRVVGSAEELRRGPIRWEFVNLLERIPLRRVMKLRLTPEHGGPESRGFGGRTEALSAGGGAAGIIASLAAEKTRAALVAELDERLPPQMSEPLARPGRGYFGGAGAGARRRLCWRLCRRKLSAELLEEMPNLAAKRSATTCCVPPRSPGRRTADPGLLCCERGRLRGRSAEWLGKQGGFYLSNGHDRAGGRAASVFRDGGVARMRLAARSN